MFKYLLILAAVTYVSCIPPAALASLNGGGLGGGGLRQLAESVSEETVAVLRQESHPVDNQGKFSWSYETSDGTKVDQSGEVDPEDPEKVKSIEGSYSYFDPEGKLHEVRYTANEDGFFPIGDDIAPELISKVN